MSSTSRWPASLNLGFAERAYYHHLRNPASGSDEWRAYLDSMAADRSVLQPTPTAGGPASRTAPLGKRGQRYSPNPDPVLLRRLPEDLNRQISPETQVGCSLSTRRRGIERLRQTYARSVGGQLMH